MGTMRPISSISFIDFALHTNRAIGVEEAGGYELLLEFMCVAVPDE